MLQAFTALRRRTLLVVGLAAAALSLAMASALAGNAGATSPARAMTPQTRSITATTRDTLVAEFGPKFLLGYELKAAQS
jgi:hypothetical protein